MYLIVNKDLRIVASSAFLVNEEDCATREQKIIYIDDADYSPDMVGCLYAEQTPYYVAQPSPFHTVKNGEYTIDKVGIDQYWQAVRTFRNRLLTATDWTQLSDVALKEEEKLYWVKIRTELRDIMTEADDPAAVMRSLETYAILILGQS